MPANFELKIGKKKCMLLGGLGTFFRVMGCDAELTVASLLGLCYVIYAVKIVFRGLPVPPTIRHRGVHHCRVS